MSKQHPASEWKNLPGPETIQRVRLPNGITLLCYNNPHVSSVNLVGLLEGGSALDPQDKLGLGHFTAGMLTRGTSRRSFNAFHQELEERGASLSFSSGANHTSFHGKGLAEDIEILFDLASDGLREPSFSQEYFERLRAQLLAGLALRDQDTGEAASLLFDGNLFPCHPYGRPEDGYVATIQAITREDVIQFHREHYNPQDMLLVVAGAIQPNSVQELAEQYFGSWASPTRKEFSMPPIPEQPGQIIRKHCFIEEKSQVDLILGSLGPNRTSADFHAVYLGNNILGQFGLMGRIGESVRSRSGLAYYASSSVSAWSDCGTWEFNAGTNPENLEKAIELIRTEIKRFVSSSVTQEELDDSQSNLIGRLPLSLESNAGVANAILSMERFQLGLDYYQRYAKLLRAVSADDILTAAQKYLDPDRLVIASAGPGHDIL